MKRFLPDRMELVILAVAAVLAAVVFSALEGRESVLAVVAFPVVLGAMLMGAWKNGRFANNDD